SAQGTGSLGRFLPWIRYDRSRLVEGVCAMKRVVLAFMLGSLLMVGTVARAAPKKSPSGTGSSVATCWAAPGTAEPGATYELHATGLPTDTALNVGITTNGHEVIYPF